MEQILKTEIVDILNKIQRRDAPQLVNNGIVPAYVVHPVYPTIIVPGEGSEFSS